MKSFVLAVAGLIGQLLVVALLFALVLAAVCLLGFTAHGLVNAFEYGWETWWR